MSIIDEIQREALDETVSLSTVLRKVKLVASKLGLKDTAVWVDSELGGYGSDPKQYPEYRFVLGKVEAFSPYHGWQSPAGDSEMIDALCRRQISDSVASLEDLIARNSEGTLALPISSKVQQGILSANPGWTDIHTKIQRSHLVAIVSHVRTLALNWALELEEKGVSGEGLSFSANEREQAKSVQIHIGSFHGNLHNGEISGTQNRVNLGSTDSSINAVQFDSVISEIERAAHGFSTDSKEELNDILGRLRDAKADKGSFATAYSSFVSFAADHVALLPFVPALAQLMPV